MLELLGVGNADFTYILRVAGWLGGPDDWWNTLHMVELTQQPRQAKRRAAEAVHHRHNATPKTVHSNTNHSSPIFSILQSQEVDP